MIEKLKKINWYPLIPFFFLLLVQLLAYYSSKAINSSLQPEDYHVVKWAIDDKIPLIPATSVIYFGCYLWWGISPLIMGKYLTKDRFYRFVLATVIVHFISFLAFVIYPTWMADRPESIDGSGPFVWLTQFILKSDVPDSLLPSMHSTVSWLAVVPFMRAKDSKVPKKIIVIQAVIACLVFVSTVTTRQHYLIDFIVSIVLVEIVFFVTTKVNWHLGLQKMLTSINVKLGIEKKQE